MKGGKHMTKKENNILQQVLDNQVELVKQMAIMKTELLEGQRRLEKGQEELNGRVGNLEKGQEELKERVGNLEKGQEELKERVGNLERGQEKLEKGQEELKGRVDNLEQGQNRLEKQQEEFNREQIRLNNVLTLIEEEHGRKIDMLCEVHHINDSKYQTDSDSKKSIVLMEENEEQD